jgi:hypothetical protein
MIKSFETVTTDLLGARRCIGEFIPTRLGGRRVNLDADAVPNHIRERPCVRPSVMSKTLLFIPVVIFPNPRSEALTSVNPWTFCRIRISELQREAASPFVVEQTYCCSPGNRFDRLAFFCPYRSYSCSFER